MIDSEWRIGICLMTVTCMDERRSDRRSPPLQLSTCTRSPVPRMWITARPDIRPTILRSFGPVRRVLRTSGISTGYLFSMYKFCSDDNTHLRVFPSSYPALASAAGGKGASSSGTTKHAGQRSSVLAEMRVSHPEEMPNFPNLVIRQLGRHHPRIDQ